MSALTCRLAVGLALMLAFTLPVRAEDRAAPAKDRPAAAKDVAAPAKESIPPAVDAKAPDAISLQERVANLEGDFDTYRKTANPAGGVTLLALFLCGAFCALWAQNTNRNCWLWFFLGVIPLFNAITLIVLLGKNARDRKRRRPAPAPTAPPEVHEPVGV
jgi:hypothetical protein